jgi:hypothetical protein
MAAPQARTTAVHLKWIASLWAGFALFDAVQTVFSMRAQGMHHAWITLFFTDFFSWLPWALATPWILSLGRRYPATTLKAPRTWLIHLGACALIELAFNAWTTGLLTVFNPYLESHLLPYVTLFRFRIYNGMLAAVILYSIVMTIAYVLDSHQRLIDQQTETARISEQLSRAQLDALRRQIEPHFLFNTLNSIAGLVREARNDDAVNMIAGLSDLLRRSLEGAPHQQVPLREEVEFAQKYLDIQKMRFTDRLQVQMDIPRELSRAQVPSLILQPMVENAILHGIAHRAQGGTIRIVASESAGTLTLRIGNDGPALPLHWQSSSTGIGIANVRSRLRSLYGEACNLDLHDRAAGGVEVALSLPFVVPAEG